MQGVNQRTMKIHFALTIFVATTSAVRPDIPSSLDANDAYLDRVSEAGEENLSVFEEVIRARQEYPEADEQRVTKQKIEKMFMQSGERQIFPEGCMERWMRERQILEPEEVFPFSELWEKNKVNFYNKEGFTAWINAGYKVEKLQKSKYTLLLLALWGLFEKPEYTSLNAWKFKDFHGNKPQKGTWSATFGITPTLFEKGWNYLMYIPDSKYQIAYTMMYSLYLLGVAIPSNEPFTQRQVENIIDDVYGSDCSVMSPLIMSETGNQILLYLKAHMDGNAFTKDIKNVGNFFGHAATLMKNANTQQKSLKDNVGKNQQALLDTMVSTNQTDTQWSYVASIVHLAYLDHFIPLMVATASYGNALNPYSAVNPFSWFSEPDHDPQNSPFIKSLFYFGRTFMKLGAAAVTLQKDTNEVGREVFEMGGSSGSADVKPFIRFWEENFNNDAKFFEETYSEIKYPGIFPDPQPQ